MDHGRSGPSARGVSSAKLSPRAGEKCAGYLTQAAKSAAYNRGLSSRWKAPRSHLRLGRSRARDEATSACERVAAALLRIAAYSAVTRREGSSAVAGGLTRSHTRACPLGDGPARSGFTGVPPADLRIAANERKFVAGGVSVHSRVCSGFISIGRRSDGRPRSRGGLPERRRSVPRGARVSFTRVPHEMWAGVRSSASAARHAVLGLPGRQRLPGQARRRKKTPPASLGRRSKRAARREASCSRAAGIRRPAALEVKLGCSLKSWVRSSSLDASRLAPSIRSSA